MATDTSIANLALTECGSARISSLTDNSKGARAVNACYDEFRMAMLRTKRWKFAIHRAQLAIDTTPPLYTRTNRFRLPNDFLRIIPADPLDRVVPPDWAIEGSYILTNDGAPLNIRYIRDITVENDMDPLFRIALALRIADHIIEELTGSNQKRQILNQRYEDTLNQAAQVDAIERSPVDPAVDDWITTRTDGRDYSKGWG